jgi:hypothetical protein
MAYPFVENPLEHLIHCIHAIHYTYVVLHGSAAGIQNNVVNNLVSSYSVPVPPQPVARSTIWLTEPFPMCY